MELTHLSANIAEDLVKSSFTKIGNIYCFFSCFSGKQKPKHSSFLFLTFFRSQGPPKKSMLIGLGWKLLPVSLPITTKVPTSTPWPIP